MNQTKKDIKDFLISKDIKFSSIFEIDKLPGGSSNETWIIKYKNDSCVEKIVLRRHFQGIRNIDNEYPPLSLKIESDVMIAAYDEKIPVPKILYRTESKSSLGEGFFMEFIEGVALGNKIVDNNFLKSKKVNLSEQCGYHLSKIHKINHKKLENIQKSEAIDEFRKYFEIYKNYNLSIPVFDLSFKWLEKNIPNNEKLHLLHGDFRNGNILMSEETGIKSILDWELLHLGDPHEDLAWICVNSWRFGKMNKPVGGFGERKDFYSSYEKESNFKINKKSIQFWEVLGTLKWGIMCLKMYDAYKSGYDKSVDRAAIGRRSSETEIDLLRLITKEFLDE
tara:strand:- start:474 stop:1481 length:1008 start_codon:yes stop_codon:yes gene_type:complete